MTPIEKISLYDFAKMVLGGREPASVSIFDANKNEEVTKISYFGTNDKLESLRFSQDDFFADMSKSEEMVGNSQFHNSEFPGVV